MGSVGKRLFQLHATVPAYAFVPLSLHQPERTCTTAMRRTVSAYFLARAAAPPSPPLAAASSASSPALSSALAAACACASACACCNASCAALRSCRHAPAAPA